MRRAGKRKLRARRPPSVAAIVARLQGAYGRRRWRPDGARGLDQLVATILSQNTNDRNSSAAYERLRGRFRSWEALRRAPVGEIERAIRGGGLARLKARRLKRIVHILGRRRGRLSLEFLRDAPLEEARRVLGELPGVGPKTVSCVLMFAFNRPVLPVDTHVHRVSLRLGLIPPGTTAEKAHALLQARTPDRLVYPFHVLLVEHGRRTCRARRPACGCCALANRCFSAGRV